MGSTQDLPATDSPNGDLPRRYMQRYMQRSMSGLSRSHKDKRSFRRQHNPSQYDRTLTLNQGRSGRSYP